MTAATRWRGHCLGCSHERELETRYDHSAKALCDDCAAKPHKPPSAGADDFEVAHVAQAQGVGPVGHPPATLRRVDVATMLTSDPEPVDWIAEGIVARGTLTLLAGREKEGKSLLAMAIAARAATGGGFLAGVDVSAARTLIVDAENGERELHRRLRSSGLAHEHADRIEVYETHAHDLRRHLHELEAVLESHRPDLVVLDSWRSLWGGDENDAGEVARVLDPLRNLIRGHNAGALLVHHMRKGGGYRGSSAIGASVENVIEMARMEDDPERRRRRLRNTACRYEQEADERWLSIEADRERGLLLIAETDAYVAGRAPH
jgi:predicted ATP-dependent serine protease